MSIVSGIIHHGKVVFDQPVDWAEGTRVHVVPDQTDAKKELTEEEEASDPASIQCWISTLEALPPIQMTQQEEAEWKKGLAEMHRKTVESLQRKINGIIS